MIQTIVPPLNLLVVVLLAATRLAATPTVCTHLGETQRDFSDPERRAWLATGPRQLGTMLWYPAATTAAQTQVESKDGRCAGGDVHVEQNAPFASAPERFPIVLLSHGSGNHADQLRWLAVALARHGYIVAAVDHNGSREEELGELLTATDFFAWERARDISVVLDRILDDPELGPKIDETRIGAAGFSLGGTTVLWLGGARLDLERLRTQSPPPPPFLQESIAVLLDYSRTSAVGQASIKRAAGSYQDRRIKGIFALSPAMGPGFPEEGLRAVNVPVFIAVGDADVITPLQDNAARFANAIPRARLVVLPGERGHYTSEIPPEQREAELAEVSELAVRFFSETL